MPVDNIQDEIRQAINSLIEKELKNGFFGSSSNVATCRPATLEHLRQAKAAMNPFNGIAIRESKHFPEFAPVRSLSNEVHVSDSYRDEFNAWLIDIFGRHRAAMIIDVAA